MITLPPKVRDPELYDRMESRAVPAARPTDLPQYEIAWFWRDTGLPVMYDDEGFVIAPETKSHDEK